MELDKILSEEARNQTARVVLTKTPDGEDDAVLIIVGPNSPQYLAEQARQRREGLKRRNAKGGALDLTTDQGAEDMDAAVQANLLGSAVAVVIDWEGFTQGGQPLAFDAAKARALLEARPAWRDRVLAKVESEAAFLPA